MDNLGARLRVVRERRGLTQVAVARNAYSGEALDADKVRDFSNYISRVERGVETNPSLDLLERIARGLGLSLSALFLQMETLHSTAELSKVIDGSQPVPVGVVDVPGPLSAPDRVILTELRAFVAHLAEVLAAAAAQTPAHDRPATSPDDEESEDRDVSA